MVAAVTDDTSNGSSEPMLRSNISTSSTNTRPAIGALNMPAIAPAEPQPTSSMSVRCSILNIRPILEPMAEPVSTIGLSAPTDPPIPIVMALAMTDEYML